MIILITLCLNSCVVSHTVTLTNNPVGSEKFRLTTNDLSTNVGLSIVEAKKLSGITEISILEYKKINYFFANVEHITITGSTTKSEKHEKNKE
ncbi:MAG: hypothetical protein JJT77_02695 [Crocinitomicaceae bacterium]|nr:hypothetical protein [Crocinitomicaceae bacterium]